MSKWMALLWQSLVNARPAGQTPGLDCDRRQTPRFPSALQISCRPATSSDVPPLPVCTRDISAGGIGLDSPHFFEPDTLLEIERLDSNGRPQVRVISCVRHGRQTGNTWALGCSFIRDLDDSELGAFEPSL